MAQLRAQLREPLRSLMTRALGLCMPGAPGSRKDVASIIAALRDVPPHERRQVLSPADMELLAEAAGDASTVIFGANPAYTAEEQSRAVLVLTAMYSMVFARADGAEPHERTSRAVHVLLAAALRPMFPTSAVHFAPDANRNPARRAVFKHARRNVSTDRLFNLSMGMFMMQGEHQPTTGDLREHALRLIANAGEGRWWTNDPRLDENEKLFVTEKVFEGASNHMGVLTRNIPSNGEVIAAPLRLLVATAPVAFRGRLATKELDAASALFVTAIDGMLGLLGEMPGPGTSKRVFPGAVDIRAVLGLALLVPNEVRTVAQIGCVRAIVLLVAKVVTARLAEMSDVDVTVVTGIKATLEALCQMVGVAPLAPATLAAGAGAGGGGRAPPARPRIMNAPPAAAAAAAAAIASQTPTPTLGAGGAKRKSHDDVGAGAGGSGSMHTRDDAPMVDVGPVVIDAPVPRAKRFRGVIDDSPPKIPAAVWVALAQDEVITEFVSAVRQNGGNVPQTTRIDRARILGRVRHHEYGSLLAVLAFRQTHDHTNARACVGDASGRTCGPFTSWMCASCKDADLLTILWGILVERL